MNTKEDYENHNNKAHELYFKLVKLLASNGVASHKISDLEALYNLTMPHNILLRSKSEIAQLKSQLAKAEEIIKSFEIEKWTPSEPEHKNGCMFCDMGDSGYATKGYHDRGEIPCLTIRVKEYFAQKGDSK